MFTDTLCFRILQGMAILFALDGGCLLLAPGFQVAKYLFFLVLLGIVVVAAMTTLSLTVRPVFPLGFLILAAIGMLSFFVLRVGTAGESYASALLPMLLVGLAAFLPSDRSGVDFDRLTRFFLTCTVVFTATQVAAQILMAFWPFVDPTWFENRVHEKMATAAYGFALAVLMGRWRLVLLFGGLIGIALALRASSTLAAALVLGGALALALRYGAVRLAVAAGVAVLIALAAFPLVYLAEPESATLLFGIEPFVKEQVLGAHSNTDFRLKILQLAREEFLGLPLLTGHAFLGSPNVHVGSVIPDWAPPDAENLGLYAPIHSDFFLLLWEGGLVGYALAIGTAASMVACFLRSARLARARGDTAAEVYFQAGFIQLVVISVYISFNPIMTRYSIMYFVWLSVLMGGIGARQLRQAVGRTAAPCGGRLLPKGVLQ